MTTPMLGNEDVAWSPCERAIKLVRDRGQNYGPPEVNHACTADLWTTYLQRIGLLDDLQALTPRHVCMLNALQKISRDAERPKQDNVDDVAGYMENIGMMGGGDA